MYLLYGLLSDQYNKVEKENAKVSRKKPQHRDTTFSKTDKNHLENNADVNQDDFNSQSAEALLSGTYVLRLQLLGLFH